MESEQISDSSQPESPSHVDSEKMVKENIQSESTDQPDLESEDNGVEPKQDSDLENTSQPSSQSDDTDVQLAQEDTSVKPTSEIQPESPSQLNPVEDVDSDSTDRPTLEQESKDTSQSENTDAEQMQDIQSESTSHLDPVTEFSSDASNPPDLELAAPDLTEAEDHDETKIPSEPDKLVDENATKPTEDSDSQDSLAVTGQDQQEPQTLADSSNNDDEATEAQESDKPEQPEEDEDEALDVNKSVDPIEEKTHSEDQTISSELEDKDEDSVGKEGNDDRPADENSENDTTVEKPAESEKEVTETSRNSVDSVEEMETGEARVETDSSEVNKQDKEAVAMDTDVNEGDTENKKMDESEDSASMEVDKDNTDKEANGTENAVPEGDTESTAEDKREGSDSTDSKTPAVDHTMNKESKNETEKPGKGGKGEDDDLVLIEDDKPETIVVDDDDDDDGGSKNKLANGVLNSGNDMGLQISSVMGGAEMPADSKDKNKENEKVKDERKSPPPEKKTVEKKAPITSLKSSKSLTCIVCTKVGRCKYNIVRNGDTKHLCDEDCFQRFKSNPTQFLKGTPATTAAGIAVKSPTTRSRTGSLPASSPRNYREEPDLPVVEIPGSTKPAAPASTSLLATPPTMVVNNTASQYKTCTVCQLMNINTQKPFASWQGLDFCGEMCLNKFQSTLSASCSFCTSFIPAATRALYSTKVGQDIRLFCTTKCLQDFKKSLRLCAFCQNDLSGCPDSFSAPIGPQTFREFCSQTCLKKFEDKYNDVEIIGFESSKPKTAAKCSVCHKISTVKHNIKLNGVLNRLCSDPCLSAFQYANKLAMNTCDNCGGLCPTEESISHFIQFEGQQKRFCKDTCVNTFRTINRKIVPCAWCGTKKPNFDMIERVDSNNKYQLFCSLNCLSLYRVNLQAKSNQSVNCDYCHKFVPAQYHLTMSDASVRNFCSYNCVMVFQSQFSANKSSSQPTIHSQPTKIQLQQKPTVRGNIENTAPVMTTRRRQATQNTSQQSSFPIISNVVSLAPQGSQKGQTLNIKSSSSVPVIVSGQSQTIRVGAKTVTAGTGTQPSTTTQQIIIQPPPPKQMKNKSLLCKPFVQTKATSCRPHVQTKEVQTDGDHGKPLLIPVPVPIYVPTPLAMYAVPTPQFIPIPIPIPIPIFIPTTKKSAAKILKQIKKIREKIPADPLEAELLQMAQAVAGGGEDSDSESEHSDLEEKSAPIEEVNKVEEEPSDMDMLESQIDRSGGEEDLVQMALRMAEEITGPVLDLESNVQLVAVSNEPPAVIQVARAPIVPDEEDDDWIPSRESRSRRGKRSTTGRGRGRQPKRQRVEAYREPTPEPSPPPVQQPPADANMHLKFTYGVNAWKHWVIHKNTLLEKVSRRGSGKLKLFKTDLLQCTADELNYSLCLFVKEVRKPNGEEYSPDSIYYLCLGIQQYLYENSRIDNIFTDVYYEKFTECLTEMLAKHEPKVNTSGQMLCRIEEEHLWECKQLGAHSPYVLLNTLIYFNTKHFMLKTIEEHMKLSFAHILKHWKKGVPPTTTRTPINQVGRSVSLRYYYGQSNNKKPKEGIPVYETSENLENPLRCPVKLYEFYLSKAPESIKNRNDLFYLLPERSCVPDSPVWYSTQSIPVETMSKMLGRILLVREIQEAHLHAQPVYV